MDKIIAICGLPRAGSTLLQNTLSQNPKFSVSRLTSNVPAYVESLRQTWSNAQETPGLMLAYPDYTERFEDILRFTIERWHEPEKIPVEKTRGWTGKVPLLRQLYPQSKVLVCVRDPRDVFASCERLDMKDRTLNKMKPGRSALIDKAKIMFNEQGMIGSCIHDVMDLEFRKSDYHLVKFEDFVVRPRLILSEIYDYLEVERFDHDVNDVPQYAQDFDEIYMRKFLHTASGKIEPPKGGWRDCFSAEMAQIIVAGFPEFYAKFYADRL